MNDIKGNVKVKYKGVEYITGNRRHDLVELYMNGKFIRIVNYKQLRIIK